MKGDDLELRVSGMAQSVTFYRLQALFFQCAQLGDTFLSSKHQDYLAAIAEFSSAVRD